MGDIKETEARSPDWQSPPSEHDQLAHLVEVEIPALEAALVKAGQERDGKEGLLRIAHECIGEQNRQIEDFEARELGILVEWYKHDAVSCANYCDKVLDYRGALLGRVRQAVLKEENVDAK